MQETSKDGRTEIYRTAEIEVPAPFRTDFGNKAWAVIFRNEGEGNGYCISVQTSYRRNTLGIKIHKDLALDSAEETADEFLKRYDWAMEAV